MVSKTTDHGNNLMVAQFVFSFSHVGFFKNVQWKWTSKTVNVIAENKLRAFSHLKILMSLHGQAMDIIFLEPTILLLSQKEVAFVQVYISRRANSKHKPGLNTLAFALNLFKCALISL